MHPPVKLEDLRLLEYDFMLAPQQQQQTGQSQPQQDGFGNAGNMAGDLDMFANAQFFDFDMGELPENSLLFPDGLVDNNASNAADRIPNDYLNAGEYNLNAFPGQANAFNKIHTAHAHQTSGLYNRQSRGSLSSPSTDEASPVSGNAAYNATQAKLTAEAAASGTTTEDGEGIITPSEPLTAEETAAAAAEEDKRRRNTAASARFRVKKKQREQALEKIAKEMTDRVNQLETKVSQLEMENKILKNLITEKSGNEIDMDEVKRKVIEATPDESPTLKSASKERKSKVRVEKAAVVSS